MTGRETDVLGTPVLFAYRRRLRSVTRRLPPGPSAGNYGERRQLRRAPAAAKAGRAR